MKIRHYMAAGYVAALFNFTFTIGYVRLFQQKPGGPELTLGAFVIGVLVFSLVGLLHGLLYYAIFDRLLANFLAPLSPYAKAGLYWTGSTCVNVTIGRPELTAPKLASLALMIALCSIIFVQMLRYFGRKQAKRETPASTAQEEES